MTPPSGMFTTTRPRPSRLRHATLGIGLALVICAISYTIIWDHGLVAQLSSGRQLAYLDTYRTSPLPYGRIMINQNYQALLQPSGIDSSLFRTKQQGGGGDMMYDKGYADDDSACDNALLFLPQSFAHNGHGSQLNNYLLAAMIATFTNRAMIVLEPPASLNDFKSNSQFGCPSEAWKTVMVRAGGVPKRIGWNADFPAGLSRLVKHPAWLSRQCPVPCQESHGYEDWDELRRANNITLVPTPQEVTCTNANNGRQSNVIAMGGRQIRDYFAGHYKEYMLDRSPPASLEAAMKSSSTLKMNFEWALRLGAAPHEARIFGGLQDRHEIWDYASAFMGRAGILRFQPWIARDVEEYITQHTKLPLDVPYDAIHVRRGDKLESDAKHHVITYWSRLGMYNNETGSMPRDYIPFTHYLSMFDDVECNAEGEPRLVYVATDDPTEVQKEINALPKEEGNPLLTKYLCHKFQFVFSPFEQSLGFHIETGPSKGDCEERYTRNVASIADLMILTKSDMFVGEYNSNWGRLVRTFRLKMNDSAKIMNGARPVLERRMKVAWGHQHPGPPGW